MVLKVMTYATKEAGCITMETDIAYHTECAHATQGKLYCCGGDPQQLLDQLFPPSSDYVVSIHHVLITPYRGSKIPPLPAGCSEQLIVTFVWIKAASARLEALLQTYVSVSCFLHPGGGLVLFTPKRPVASSAFAALPKPFGECHAALSSDNNTMITMRASQGYMHVEPVRACQADLF